MHTDIIQLVQAATDAFLIEVMQYSKSIQQAKSSGKLLLTVAYQFRDQVESLIKMLGSTQSNYIRCLKPNSTKSPFQFNGGMILQQLQYFGVLESIRIRRAGYAVRMTCSDFVRRFNVLVELADRKIDPKVAATRVLKKSEMQKGRQYQVGASKVFLKTTDEIAHLEKLVVKKIEKQLLFIQSRVRGFLVNKMYKRLKLATIIVQRYMRRWQAKMMRKQMIKAIVMIQAEWRAGLARVQVDKLREERGLASLAEKRKGDAEKNSQEKARESAADKALQAADAISKKNKAKAAAGGILREDQPTEEDLREVEQKKEIGELVSLMKELVGGDEDLVQDKLIKILSSESFAKQNNLSLQQGGASRSLTWTRSRI